MYLTRGKFRVLSPSARAWKEDTEALLRTLDLPHMEAKPLRVTVCVHRNWLTKDGRVKKADVQNREKALLDVIFPVIGVDDSYVWDLRLIKVQDTEEKTEIEILAL